MTSPWLLGLLLCSCLLWTTALTKPTYKLLFSKTVRSGSTMGVGVHITGVKKLVNLNLELMDYDGLRLQEGQTFPVTNGFQVIYFKFSDKLKKPVYTVFLRASAWGGMRFDHFERLWWRNRRITVFLQTDRRVYKGGDTVKFRAVAMLPDTKVSEETIGVVIKDPLKSIVKAITWTKKDGNEGVVEGQMPIPKDCRLGEYTIRAIVKGASKTKYFTIKKYDSPDFEVLLWLPRVSYTDTEVKAKIFGKYLIGTPVSGSGTLTVQAQRYYSYYYYRYYGRYYGSSVKLEKQFTLDKHGRADITYNMKELRDLICKTYYSYYYYYRRYYCYRSSYYLLYRTMRFTAEVSDDNSHHIVKKNKDIRLTAYKFYLRYVSPTPYRFKPGLPFYAYIQDVRSSGQPNRKPVQSFLNYTVRYTNGSDCRFYWKYSKWSTLQEGTVNLSDDTSTAELKISTVPHDACTLYIRATNGKYTTSRYFYMYYSPSRTYFHVQVSKDLVVDRKRKVTVMSNKPFTSFNYYMYAKGALVIAKRQGRSTNSTVAKFNFEVNAEMTPLIHIVAYYTTNQGEMVAAKASLPVEYYPNKVKLRFKPDQKEKHAKPGEKVFVKAEAEDKTYLFLLGRDERGLTKANDIKAEDVTTALMTHDIARFYRYYRYEYDVYDMLYYTGLAVITNLKVPGKYYYHSYYIPRHYRYSRYYYYYYYRRYYYYGCRRFQAAPSPPERLHNMLELTPAEQIELIIPPTWLFETIRIGSTGKKIFKTFAPDTLTSLTITGFAVHPTLGLSVIEEPITLITEKKMFVTMYSPESAVRGEVFCLKAIAHNTEEAKNHTVEMTIKKSKDFDVVDIQKDGNSSKEVLRYANVKRDIGTIEAGIMKVATFCIKPKTIGDINVQVTADADDARDKLKRTISVEPEGIRRSQTFPFLIEILSATGKFYKAVDVKLPSNVVDSSYRVTAEVIGDFLAQPLDKMGNILQMPYGCGEQTMIHMASNTYILEYLKKMGRLSSATQTMAKNVMQKGYHQEMLFQRYDGSFSAFGNSDKNGSMWLTTFVAKIFIQASDLGYGVIIIEPDMIRRAIGWMTQYQNSDGSFVEMGRVIHSALQGGSAANKVRLTAFVTIALVEAKNILRRGLQPVAVARVAYALPKAVSFLEGELSNVGTDDPYTSCIIAYALAMAGSSKTEEALLHMNNSATYDGNRIYWSGDNKAHSIEITSYALLALVKEKRIQQAIKVFRWLNTQRGRNGGFSSTQDTVIGMQALSVMTRVALKSKFSETITVNVTVVRKDTANFPKTAIVTVNKDNLLQAQKPRLYWMLDKVPGQIIVEGSTTTGSWLFAYAEVTVDYNVKSVPASGGLDVEVNMTSHTNHSIVLKTCVKSESASNSTYDPIVMAEVRLPTGFVLNKTATKYGDVSRATLDGNKVIMYYSRLHVARSCSTLKMEMTKADVAYLQSPEVKVYNYLNPSEECVKQYDPNQYSVCQVNPDYDDDCS